MDTIRVTVWGEYRHEKTNARVAELYPDGMHNAIAAGLREGPGLTVATATLDEPEHGLTASRLAETDVLIWWGHKAHGDVQDEIVERVRECIWEGMGLIVLHSAHFSKIFKVLMGTTCNLKWREADERERIWVVEPGHPIAAGIDDHFELDREEMYGERFDIPQPETIVFMSWFQGGEVFRSGCCYTRGKGRIFYFRPGHETYPTYYNPQVKRVIANAVRWAAQPPSPAVFFGNYKPLETIVKSEA